MYKRLKLNFQSIKDLFPKGELFLTIVVLGLSCIAGIFLFFVFRSYFWTGFVTLLFYLASRDYYLWLKHSLHNKFSVFAPIIMIHIVSLIIGLPLFLITKNLFQELLSFLFIIKVYLNEDKLIPTLLSLEFLLDFFTDKEFFWVQILNIYRQISTSYGDFLNIDSLYSIFSNTTSMIVGGLGIPLEISIKILLAILLLFFLYKDGYKIEQFLFRILPVPEELKNKIGLRFAEALKTIVKGNIIIALFQGIVVGLLLLIVGIPNTILYASVASLFSLIPVIGTMVVWLPAGFYLGLIEGRWIVAIIFMISSFTSYLILENLVKPNILDKKLNVHPFLLFLSLLGGIKEFGIEGIIIGPIALTLIVILWEFWVDHRKSLSMENKNAITEQ